MNYNALLRYYELIIVCLCHTAAAKSKVHIYTTSMPLACVNKKILFQQLSILRYRVGKWQLYLNAMNSSGVVKLSPPVQLS